MLADPLVHAHVRAHVHVHIYAHLFASTVACADTDWVGRWLGTLRCVDRSLSSARKLYAASLCRILFVPLVTWLSRGSWAAPQLLLVVLGLVGLSNGLIGTLCFLRAQNVIGDADRELGSRIMVLALYGGIAAGSIFAALAFSGGAGAEVDAGNDTAVANLTLGR